jgi:hypothetical protein
MTGVNAISAGNASSGHGRSYDRETNELQPINTAWQIAIEEILRMVVSDI